MAKVGASAKQRVIENLYIVAASMDFLPITPISLMKKKTSSLYMSNQENDLTAFHAQLMKLVKER